MPSRPERAGATAIGTPNNSASTSTSMGSAATMCEAPPELEAARLRRRRLFPEQIRLAAADPRQVVEHEQGERQEAQRNQAVGGSDQQRERAQLGVVVQAAPRLLA